MTVTFSFDANAAQSQHTTTTVNTVTGRSLLSSHCNITVWILNIGMQICWASAPRWKDKRSHDGMRWKRRHIACTVTGATGAAEAWNGEASAGIRRGEAAGSPQASEVRRDGLQGVCSWAVHIYILEGKRSCQCSAACIHKALQLGSVTLNQTELS